MHGKKREVIFHSSQKILMLTNNKSGSELRPNP
jgi:hypothetical protein